jgi:predicted RNA-binding protein YlxR (DUF448 family)
MVRVKHIPQRTCVGCQRVAPKRELVRIVRSPDRVEVDPSGKKKGRGAYLCLQQGCWETALAKRSLDYALKTTLRAEEKESLLEYIRSLEG